MKPIQSHTADKFSTTFTLPSINVGSITTRIGALTGGDQPDETVIVLDVPERGAALTPSQALSLAAALQASSVHVMEEQTDSARKAA